MKTYIVSSETLIENGRYSENCSIVKAENLKGLWEWHEVAFGKGNFFIKYIYTDEL